MITLPMRLVGSAVLASAGLNALGESQRVANCAMRPLHHTFTVPALGLAGLKDDELEGPCETVRAELWERRRAGTIDLMVAADGPNGSGRYWTVTVGVAERGAAAPTGGFCLSASTVGWRTLQSYQTPLKWVDDRDRDGRPEFILWSSFDFRWGEAASAFGLNAWVYEWDGRGAFVLDLAQSRAIAGSLAAAYRQPLAGDDPYLKDQRNAAARDLGTFASSSCTLRVPRDWPEAYRR